MKIIISIVILIIVNVNVSAQPIYLYIDTIKACKGDTIEVHIKTVDFHNVGALTLYIGYQENDLHYDTTINIHSSLTGMMINPINYPDKRIGFAWFTTTMQPVNIDTGIIASMIFIVKKENTQISFLSGCEVACPTGIFLNVSYSDGIINKRDIPIDFQPENITVPVTTTAFFQITSSVSNPNYQWQQSKDGTQWKDLTDSADISGSNSSTLYIENVKAELHESSYRCILMHENCETISDEALLFVDTSGTIIHKPLYICNINTNPYPNPFLNNINIPLSNDKPYWFNFVMFDLTGRVVYKTEGKVKNKNIITITDIFVPSGVYTYQCTFYNSDGSEEQHNKQIIAQ